MQFIFSCVCFYFLLSNVLDILSPVLPTMTLQEHAGNEKSCVWHAPDFADGELKDELFCLRFASIESESSHLCITISIY